MIANAAVKCFDCSSDLLQAIRLGFINNSRLQKFQSNSRWRLTEQTREDPTVTFP